jgi:hypothetical protein
MCEATYNSHGRTSDGSGRAGLAIGNRRLRAMPVAERLQSPPMAHGRPLARLRWRSGLAAYMGRPGLSLGVARPNRGVGAACSARCPIPDRSKAKGVGSLAACQVVSDLPKKSRNKKRTPSIASSPPKQLMAKTVLDAIGLYVTILLWVDLSLGAHRFMGRVTSLWPRALF